MKTLFATLAASVAKRQANHLNPPPQGISRHAHGTQRINRHQAPSSHQAAYGPKGVDKPRSQHWPVLGRPPCQSAWSQPQSPQMGRTVVLTPVVSTRATSWGCLTARSPDLETTEHFVAPEICLLACRGDARLGCRGCSP